MADEFQNWWDTSRNRFDISGGTTTSAPPPIPIPLPPTSINTTTLNSIAAASSANYGWQPASHNQIIDMKSAAGGSNLQVMQRSSGQSSNINLANTNLQIMGLGLSSQTMDNWNQTLIGDQKVVGNLNFSSILQEEDAAGEDEYKQSINRGFSLDQPQFHHQINHHQASSNDSSTITTAQQNLNTSGFQVDSEAAAAYGLLLSDNNNINNNNQQPSVHNMNYQYPTSGYGGNSSDQILMPSWNKFPQFLRTSSSSPPKQQPLSSTTGTGGSSHLQFTNDTPYWNASATSMNFPAPQINNNPGTTSSFDDQKPKITSEVRELGTTTKKNNTEVVSNKRPRSETPSPLPAFKVRKEKMGDRITALQQLVSPFGKTDTASVLSEAIEYIKFLHEQVNVLSTPYLKNVAPIQHQQDPEGPRQDLRSRGLCLVPVSSTFPVTHETTVDFWTPTFGGTFR